MASSNNSPPTPDRAMQQYVDQTMQEQSQSFAGQFGASGDQIQQLTAALGATTLTPNRGGRPAPTLPLTTPPPIVARNDQREHFQGLQPPPCTMMVSFLDVSTTCLILGLLRLGFAGFMTSLVMALLQCKISNFLLLLLVMFETEEIEEDMLQ